MRVKLDYDGDGSLVFVGKHDRDPGASFEDMGWYVKRLFYDEDGNLVDVQGPLVGRWSERENMSWSV